MFGAQVRVFLMIMSVLANCSCSGSGIIPKKSAKINGMAQIHWSMETIGILFVEIKLNGVITIHGSPNNLDITDARLSIIITGSNVTLTITNIQPSDAGIYRCTINMEKEHRDVQLIVSVIEATTIVGISGTVRSTSILVGDFNPSEPVIEATTLVNVFGTDRASSTLVSDFNPSASGSDSKRLELMVIAVIGFLIAFFIFFAVVSIYFFKRKLKHGKRVTNTAMAGHSYESINSSFYDRRGSSVIHDVDTSRVALAEQSILNSGAGVTNGSLSSNFNLADEEIILSPEDNDHTSAMNDISTVMTIMNQSTSVRQLQLNNNISITVDHPPIHQSGNTIHEEYLSPCSNSYERLQRRPENTDNRSYTSLKGDMTYKTQ
ncbi:hypothetical protein SNE40_005404 [Patella caerulea]|uniref:Ig-like domain-containing protein n=1 Tax=Patella caerulea TaxID=87958 RepID=A0AAN8QBD3_PATCE